jgi:hypothetical protein
MSVSSSLSCAGSMSSKARLPDPRRNNRDLEFVDQSRAQQTLIQLGEAIFKDGATRLTLEPGDRLG